MASQST
ncbi:hypothetical protein YPPY47_2220, partial [Yersinia pestis PY-47]